MLCIQSNHAVQFSTGCLTSPLLRTMRNFKKYLQNSVVVVVGASVTVEAGVVSVSLALVELSTVVTDVNVVNPTLDVDVGTVGDKVTLTVNSKRV